jgi:nucleoside phosphorylase
MSTSTHQQFDICILCALPEEAERLKEAFQDASAKIFKDQLPVVFKRSYNTYLRRNYDYTTITNVVGEQLSVLVTWLPENGPMETGIQLYSLLQEFNPLFAAMTGICAGDREKVKLGDIIVADRAFSYDTGKVIHGKDGSELLRDTQMWSLPTEVLQAVKGFSAWKQVVKEEKRPPSIHQQRDWLLNRLLAPNTLRIDDIPEPELEEHIPDLIKVIQELRKDGPDAYLTSDRRLNNPDKVRELRYEVVFPFKDAPQPAVYIAPMASGSAVRADNPFEEIRVPVRGTRAVEMEGAAFYRTLKEFGSIQYLLVKGVCDYADKEKDDSYHDYAGRISALYLFAFLREHVTSSRFPYMRLQEKAQETSFDPSISPEQDQSSTQPVQNGLNLFYSFAPEDEDMRQELEKHLVLLMAKRGGPIRKAYANNIHAGLSNNAAVFLAQAQIILLLISPRFIADDNLYEMQLKRAFELQRAGNARIVPILLRPTELRGTPLADVVVLPKYKPPISEWKSKDAAYYEVSKGIREVVESFKQ